MGTMPKRVPLLERVEERLREGGKAALRAVFKPPFLEVADDHRFPYRVETEVVALERPGEFWHSMTAYPTGGLTDASGAEEAALLVAGRDAYACVIAFTNGLSQMKKHHDGTPPKM